MSYDLWFSLPKERAFIGDAYREYAAGMPMTRRVDETRLLCENLNTGVYCAFDYTEPTAEQPADTSGAAITGLAFNQVG